MEILTQIMVITHALIQTLNTNLGGRLNYLHLDKFAPFLLLTEETAVQIDFLIIE
jgi:hypothetical protein